MDWSAVRSDWTRRIFAAGTLTAALCLAVGIGLRLLGAPVDAEAPAIGPALLQSVVELRLTGWSTLGVLILLATPPVGLLATFAELRRISPITAWLALAVLGVLAVSLLVALG